MSTSFLQPSYPLSSSSFSPSLTATSSSSSRPRTDIDALPELDVAMEGMPDINELFNFDEFDSGNESHSPSTISPNHTPSPVAATSPLAFDAGGNFDFLAPDAGMDFSFDFLNEKPIEAVYPMAGPSSMNTYSQPMPQSQPRNITPEISVKSEPADYFPNNLGFNATGQYGGQTLHVQATPATLPIAMPTSTSFVPAQQDTAGQSPINFSGLPVDQQLALQQLMLNILAYQSKFGFDGSSGAPANGKAFDSSIVQPQSLPLPTTIQPSMVFATSPNSGSFGASSLVSPAAASGFTSGTASTSQLSPSNQFGGSSSAPSLATPQLVTPPTAPTVKPPVPGADAEADIEADDDDDDELVSISAHDAIRPRSNSSFSLGGNIDDKLDRLAPLSSIFAAGKGKGGKKGGGMSSVVRGDDEEVDDDDSWRPSPEEYKKLSSKEKRQLRNKLSARAFRNRRKDYIGTLEGHIKERDGVIEDIRSELMHSRNENQDLRRELAALKASTMAVLHPESAYQTTESPAIFNALTLSPSLPLPAAKSAPAPKAPTPAFNPNKDRSGSAAIDSKLKWSNDNLFGGGSTICHTLLMPDTPLPASVTIPSSSPKTIIPPFAMPRTNLNPLLADRFRADRSEISSHTLQSAAAPAGRDIANQTFAEWSDNTPFSLRNMDAYRMQMWGRLAREAAADKAGLEGALRPKFFVEPKSPTFASTSTSTATAHRSATDRDADVANETAGALASAAHLAGAITSKLASSFWSAFTTPTSSRLDTDKLTAVVTGRARLRVVDEEKRSPDRSRSGAPATAPAGSIEDDLLAALGGLRLQAGRSEVGRTAGVGAREDPLRAITGGLFKLAAGAS